VQVGIVPAGHLRLALSIVNRSGARITQNRTARAAEKYVRWNKNEVERKARRLMIRGWIKTGAARVMSQTGMDKVVGALSGYRNVPMVIGYHRVVEDFASSAEMSIPSMLVSLRMLERHLDWIGHRFQFVSLDELGARLDSGRFGDAHCRDHL
jgi:hypothetical protein